MQKNEAVESINHLIEKLESLKTKSFILEWSEHWQKVGRINFEEEIQFLQSLANDMQSNS